MIYGFEEVFIDLVGPNFLKGNTLVGCNDKDHWLEDVSVSAVFSDTNSCVVTIHRGHVGVNENEAIVTVILICFLYLVKSFLTIVNRVNDLAYLVLIFFAWESHHDIVF